MKIKTNRYKHNKIKHPKTKCYKTYTKIPLSVWVLECVIQGSEPLPRDKNETMYILSLSTWITLQRVKKQADYSKFI